MLDGKFRACWMVKSSSDCLQEFVVTIKAFHVVSLRTVVLTCSLLTCPLKCPNRSQRLFFLKRWHPPLYRVLGKVHGKVSDKWIVDLI